MDPISFLGCQQICKNQNYLRECIKESHNLPWTQHRWNRLMTVCGEAAQQFHSVTEEPSAFLCRKEGKTGPSAAIFRHNCNLNTCNTGHSRHKSQSSMSVNLFGYDRNRCWQECEKCSKLLVWENREKYLVSKADALKIVFLDCSYSQTNMCEAF